MTATSARPGSVLLSFDAENVRSFRDRFELTLLSSAMSDQAVVQSVSWREGGKPIGVLPCAGIFGANGSGKSNVLRAMSDLRWLVLSSFRSHPSGGIQRHPFRLDDSASKRPSSFSVDLVLEGVRHEYGVEVNDDEVTAEWAYRYPKGRAALLFLRQGSSVELGQSEGGLGREVRRLLRPNALFLSTAAQVGHPVFLPLFQWFERNLLLADAESRQHRQARTTEMLDDPTQRAQVLSMLRAADLGVTDARRVEIDPVMKDRLRRAVRILAGVEGEADGGGEGPSFDELGIHLVHHGASGDVPFEPSDESLGTRVWFGVVGPVIDALANGSVFLADEIDSSLHPALVGRLIRLFRDPATNPRRAQLIFNSHDPTTLGDSASHPIGRDEIWFTEKDDDGSTRLYPLAGFSPRRQEAVARRYLDGRYGAVPILSDSEFTDAATHIVRSGEPALR